MTGLLAEADEIWPGNIDSDMPTSVATCPVAAYYFRGGHRLRL